MRITLWRPRLLAAAAALATLSVAAPGLAQYAPYAAQQQYPTQPQYPAQPQYAAQPQYNAQGQYGSYMPTAPTQAQPQYAAQGAYQGYQAPVNYAQQQVTQQPVTPGAQPQAYAPYAAPRMAMAYQPTAAPSPSAENLPVTPAAESVAPGAMQGGAYVAPQPVPAADNYGYGGYAPGGYESYPAANGAGCATGNCGNGSTAYSSANGGTAYGACDTCNTCGNMDACLDKRCGCGWFGGVYGLFMDRDNSNKYPLAYVTDPQMPTAYPTAAPNVVMTTRSTDVGFQPGLEFRLGCAFGGCDPCGCSCGPTWGIEGVYWTLFDESDSATYVNPTGTSRTYTMMPMYGLQYDHGPGYLPVNEYWDHGMPSMPANPIRVTTVRTSNSLEVQNLELNLLRLGVCGGGGYGAGNYSAAYGASACGGCDSGCATGGCDSGCCSTGCTPCCAPCRPRYSCTAVCGFRWMQFDEDFMFGVDYANPAWPTPTGYLNYWSTAENNLFGAQLGCNGMYRIGCKWGLHVNTLVGLYGNDVNVHQHMVSPTGLVSFIGTGEDFNVNASKTDVAMLGELRVGGSCQCSCHCRLYGGWRLIGVSGIALATEQTPNAFLNAAQMSNYVNSNGSMILHGLQTGVEWTY